MRHTEDRNTRRRQRNGFTTIRDSGRVTLLVGIAFIGFVVWTVIFALNGREDVICNGVTGINSQEQRVCTPPKTQDVKVTWSASHLRAYRYALDILPPSTVKSSRTKKTLSIKRESYRYSAFVLSAGGTINFTFSSVKESSVDVYLMTLDQYNTFENKGKSDCEWSKINTMDGSTQYTTRKATTYYIVFVAPFDDATVIENVNTTTYLYNVSMDTANEICTKSCTFKKVHNNEVVIAEYTGSLSSVTLVMNSGKGALNDERIFPLLLFCFISVCLGITLGMAVRKCTLVAKTQRQLNDCSDETTSVQSGSFVQKPLIQHEVSPGEEIESNGTAPIAPGTNNNNGDEFYGMNSWCDGTKTLENA